MLLRARKDEQRSGGKRLRLCVVSFIYSGVAGAAEGAINCY